jgi:hypothetical protein
MNPNIFDNLVNSLKKKNSPDYQMYIIQIAIGNSGIISASQVAQLMKYLSSDTDKLELAKMAYGYVIDQDSYGDTVSAKFSSKDTKPFLYEYIYRY